MNTVTEFDKGRGLREGMTVFSADGEKLGRIVALGEEHVLVEKGLVFKEDYVAPIDAVAECRDDGTVVLSLRKDEIPAEIMGTEVHRRTEPPKR